MKLRPAPWLRPGRLLPLALLALAAAAFLQLWSARIDRDLLQAEKQLVDCQLSLRYTLASATGQLDLLRVHAEQQLDAPTAGPRRQALAWLQPVPGRPAFVSVPPPSLPPDAVSTITLGAPLPAPAGERGRELAMAAGLTPFFAAVKHNLANATWVYYYSLDRLLAVYPYEKGSIVWSDALLANETLINAAPARNPDRGLYWSGIYADNAGKGLICSLVNPVYDSGGRFRGIIGFDLSVDTLAAYLRGDELAIGTPFIVNKAGQLIAHPTLTRAAGKKVLTLADALPAGLRPAAGQLLTLPPGRFETIGGAYVAAYDLETAPWRILFVVDKRRLALAALGQMRPELLGLALLVLALAFFLQADRLKEELARLAVTDPLTGLANRRRFTAVLLHESEHSRRSGALLSLLMLDIDHFKRVNDTYGHSVGDKVLAAIAGETVKTVRKIDTVGRLGGEEFAVLLPDSGPAAALAAGERIRRAVENLALTADDGRPFSVTISIGAATRDSEDLDGDELLRRADAALYSSKNNGRNKVTPYQST